MSDQTKEIQNYFRDNSYVVIRNFIDSNLAALLYRYTITQTIRADFMYTHAREDYRPNWDGEFGDGQIDYSYNHYGDAMFDTLLEASLPMMNEYTGMELVPTYSYYRFYQQGDILERHKDRESCEISTTLCLGYNASNVDQKEFPDYNWPMWVQAKNGDELPVAMAPGDMIIYRGHDIDHWREPYKGMNHSQVFLHYNDANGPFNIKYDGRPVLGIPKNFQVR